MHFGHSIARSDNAASDKADSQKMFVKVVEHGSGSFDLVVNGGLDHELKKRR